MDNRGIGGEAAPIVDDGAAEPQVAEAPAEEDVPAANVENPDEDDVHLEPVQNSDSVPILNPIPIRVESLEDMKIRIEATYPVDSPEWTAERQRFCKESRAEIFECTICNTLCFHLKHKILHLTCKEHHGAVITLPDRAYIEECITLTHLFLQEIHYTWRIEEIDNMLRGARLYHEITQDGYTLLPLVSHVERSIAFGMPPFILNWCTKNRDLTEASIKDLAGMLRSYPHIAWNAMKSIHATTLNFSTTNQSTDCILGCYLCSVAYATIEDLAYHWASYAHLIKAHKDAELIVTLVASAWYSHSITARYSYAEDIRKWSKPYVNYSLYHSDHIEICSRMGNAIPRVLKPWLDLPEKISENINELVDTAQVWVEFTDKLTALSDINAIQQQLDQIALVDEEYGHPRRNRRQPVPEPPKEESDPEPSDPGPSSGWIPEVKAPVARRTNGKKKNNKKKK